MVDFSQVIANLGQGKDGGGQQAGPPQQGAFGQAEPDQGAQQVSDPSRTAGQPDFGPGLQTGLNLDEIATDPISEYEGHQRGLKIISDFAGRGWQGMGPSTSLALALHGNNLRTRAEAYQRYLDEARLAVELGRLGIGVPGQEGATERAWREEEERKKKDPGVTPGGYNPNPSGAGSQPPAKF